MDRLARTIRVAAVKNASDIHIMPGKPVVFRQNGMIIFQHDSWSHQEIKELAGSLLSSRDQKVLKERLSVDFARTVSNIRIRINLFHSLSGLSLAVRLLPGRVPSIHDLNLHPSLQECSRLTSGLVLICGTAGCGKSTTVAAIIEEINAHRNVHIVTLEDPIEYAFTSKKSLIAQRELGTHIPSYEQGLLDVLREDPDVIVVGELREPETIRLTLHAAESGHLVIGSLHASSAEDALHRICNSFHPETQDSVRNQIASTLSFLVIQKLIFMPLLNYRVPLLSILRGTQSVKSIIRDNRLMQVENAILTGRDEGMFSMDQYRSYLDSRHDFVPTAAIFAPSEPDPSSICTPSIEPSPGLFPKDRVESESETILEIDEQATLSELIEEADKLLSR
jgi:twitching motility protein PilT